ncbi:hypothetical protein COI38_09565 [Neisseria meningitidis]|nr:hypothetical protein COI38_09565 [Neisseria meningitidis]
MCKTSAMPLMPTPPIPTKWMLVTRFFIIMLRSGGFSMRKGVILKGYPLLRHSFLVNYRCFGIQDETFAKFPKIP